MLILTRNLMQALIIDDDIIIRILGVQSKQIRLGIEAPKHMRVDREEIHLKRQTDAWRHDND